MCWRPKRKQIEIFDAFKVKKFVWTSMCDFGHTIFCRQTNSIPRERIIRFALKISEQTERGDDDKSNDRIDEDEALERRRTHTQFASVQTKWNKFSSENYFQSQINGDATPNVIVVQLISFKIIFYCHFRLESHKSTLWIWRSRASQTFAKASTVDVFLPLSKWVQFRTHKSLHSMTSKTKPTFNSSLLVNRNLVSHLHIFQSFLITFHPFDCLFCFDLFFSLIKFFQFDFSPLLCS